MMSSAAEVMHFNGRIVFDHIQKTAGQAVNAWLKSALGHGAVSPNLVGEHRELIRRFGGVYSVVSGHINFRTGDSLDPRYCYLTLLRDPIERALSWLSYLDRDVVPIVASTRDLIDGARRFLATAGEESNAAFLASVTDPYVTHFAPLAGAVNRGDQTVDVAIEILSHYMVVGCYERIDAFLWQVADKLSLPADVALQLPKVNVTSQRLTAPQCRDGLRRRLRELTEQDRKLYELVCAQVEAPRGQTRQVRAWLPTPLLPERMIDTPWLTVISAKVRGDRYTVHPGDLIELDVELLLHRDMEELEAGFHMTDPDRRLLLGSNSSMQGRVLRKLRSGSYLLTHRLVADWPLGEAHIGVAFRQVLGQDGEDLYWRDTVSAINVEPRPEGACVGLVEGQVTVGAVRLPGEAERRCKVLTARGSVRVLEPLPLRLEPSEERSVQVEIRNDGTDRWLGDATNPVRLAYHWLDTDGRVVHWEGLRTELPQAGCPAMSTLVTDMTIKAPAAPGYYGLFPTIVQDGMVWFEGLPEALTPEVAAVEVLGAVSQGGPDSLVRGSSSGTTRNKNAVGPFQTLSAGPREVGDGAEAG